MVRIWLLADHTSPLNLNKVAGAQIPCPILGNWKYTEYAKMRLQADITLQLTKNRFLKGFGCSHCMVGVILCLSH